ncbi:hypothetical protein O181_128201 [Austropuccinia psidii MF-1]|uniref:Uncharacterized protein n=1 Tax=Austropuccinia psidii MF-1 TaxID=1389203 RepID=A0A9Q3Q7G5_9BASI|nr:hypothetical protein [Austropuccinia psidii MF-1]
MDPNWPKNPKNLKFAIHGHRPQGSTHGLWKPPEGTSSCPEEFPLQLREALSLSYGPCTAGTRNGAVRCDYETGDNITINQQ